MSVELIQPLIRYRWPIAIACVVLALIVGLREAFAPTVYTSSVVLAPTDNGTDNLSDKLGRMSGLASLAGINLGGNRNGRSFDRFIVLVYSADLGAWQIKHRGILQILFADSWDPARRAWIAPHGLRASIRNLFGSSPEWQPDAFSVASTYAGHLTINHVSGADAASDTGMIRLTYSDTDPQRAAQVLGLIVADANEILRIQAQRKATIQAAYLRKKLQDVSVQDYRETLEKLLSEQEQILMLTNSQLPYAVERIDEEDLPPAPIPRRTFLYAFLAGSLGFSLAYFLAIVLYNLQAGGSLIRWPLLSWSKKGRDATAKRHNPFGQSGRGPSQADV